MRAMLQQLTASGAQVIYLSTPPSGEPVDCTVDPEGSECGTVEHSVDWPLIEAQHEIERAATEGLPGVVLVSVDDVLCPDGSCPAAIDGTLLRYDGLHYTTKFSRKIVKIIMARAEAAGVMFEAREEPA
jgi:hypothetical protein